MTGQVRATVGVAEAARRLGYGLAQVRRAFDDEFPESGYVLDGDGRTKGKERRIDEAWLEKKVQGLAAAPGMPLRKSQNGRRRAEQQPVN